MTAPDDLDAYLPDAVRDWLASLPEDESQRLVDLAAEWSITVMTDIGVTASADLIPLEVMQYLRSVVLVVLLSFSYEAAGGRL